MQEEEEIAGYVDYANALVANPIAKCRQIVAWVRKSCQRRDQLMNLIRSGNQDGVWESELPEVQLLRDVETRWSSTYLMIRRIILLYPVSFYLLLLSLYISHIFFRPFKCILGTHNRLQSQISSLPK